VTDAISNRVFRNFEPNCVIKFGVQSIQQISQTFGLAQRSRKSIEHKSMTAVQSKPVFDQLHNNFIRNEPTALRYFSGLQSEGRSQVLLQAQDSTRRGYWNTKLASDEFGLRSFA